MNLNTAVIGGTILWTIVWLFLPDRVLKKRPGLNRTFTTLGVVLGISFLIVLISGHQ